MKKILYIILCICLLLSMSACSAKTITVSELLFSPSIESAVWRIGYNQTIEYNELNDLQKKEVEKLLKTKVLEKKQYDDGVPKPGAFTYNVYINFKNEKTIIALNENVVSISILEGESVRARHEFKETFDYESFKKAFK